ncbi:MAG: 3-keto-disaccharide hydrolase [Planctomycetia bacterium]
MLRSSFAAALLAAFASIGHGATPTPPAGFTALFNGHDLTGWHGMPHFDPAKLDAMTPEDKAKQIAVWTEDAKKHWTIDGGELVNDGHGAYLTTDEEFGDVELMIEYKTVAKADSGIYLRATPQVQIWDSTEESKFTLGADKGSGALWNNSPGAKGKDPLALADKPFGEWNSFRIVQIGARTTVHLNGKLVVDDAVMENYWNRALPLRKTGSIQLQTHGGEIRWRNVFIRKIGAEEANKRLAEASPEGFEPIFNGKDFTGWTGPTENYQIEDGAVSCKAHKGGTICTKKNYADFVARLEFKVPAGGNNGLAVRYPGDGDSAYTGMTEIQILDDADPKYAKLDPRQYCGSAYGMIAAARGYTRPAGEWNFLELTVKGSSVQVEINGSVVTKGDLSKITEYMANSPHPGKMRLDGGFGFCGHGDAVSFRKVVIKTLTK